MFRTLPYVNDVSDSDHAMLTMTVVLPQHVDGPTFMAFPILVLSSIKSGWPTLYGILVSVARPDHAHLCSELCRDVHYERISHCRLPSSARSRLLVYEGQHFGVNAGGGRDNVHRIYLYGQGPGRRS